MARHNDHIETLARGTDGQYAAYAWPGGYPIFYMTADNGVLCPACANGQHGSDATRADLDPACPDDDQWRIVASDCNWEDPDLTCDHCHTRIESAYAEDTAKG